MAQLSLFQPATWTVTDLTQHLRQLLEGDYKLQDTWVIGEVSNLKRPGSGHMYFTLKDSKAALKCVMWRNAVLRQAFLPREGDAVEVHGGISVYETDGVYQLYADAIRPTGEGVLYQEFLRLKARLEAEGLFSPERKRPVPRWPHCIGIVTSPTGAALRDMLNTLRRRYPLAQVVLAPTPVQGDEAAPGIAAALRNIFRACQPDVILLARGGGSIEDLWAFNEEEVARAVAACPVPVIAGIGHETDFTIADFVADLRAPTPTAAAELATPNLEDLRDDLKESGQRLHQAISAVLAAPRWELNDLRRRLLLQSPAARLRTDRQRLDDLARRGETALRHRLQLQSLRVAGFEQRLAALNPVAVLGRGFAIVTGEQGQVIHTVQQARPADMLSVRVSDGQFAARVEAQPERQP